MGFDPSKVDVAAVIAGMNDALKVAYEQGRSDALAAVIAAAQGPAASLVDEVASNWTKPTSEGGARSEVVSRAPRGLLPAVLDQMLADHPRQKIREYETLAPSYDERVSPRSISNELRRFEGKKYQREGTRWSLIASTNNGPDQPREEKSDPMSVSSNERKNGHAAPLAFES